MATIDKRRLDRRFKKLTQNIESSSQMKKLGGFIIKTIRERTRGDGKGVKRPDGNRRKLKEVSKRYALWREKQSDKSVEAAKGRDSNLTFSGKMLDNLIIKKATKTELFIGFRGKLNEDKAQAQHDMGRAFMFLGKVEQRNAAEFVRNNILKNI